MKKKVLIVGNSVAAYSLAKKLSDLHDIYITSCAGALSEFSTFVDIREDNIKELLEFVLENDIDMTIAVSIKAIMADIASIFASNKQLIFAPAARAAESAIDKVKVKKLFYKLHIPTPKFGIFDKQNVALDYLKNQRVPFVIKTNANNSATIITSMQSAKIIIDSVFIEKNNKIIIEDYIYGTPFSFYALTDGYKALPLGNSLTYKHSLEGDGGQLTNGMGACVPNYKLSLEQEYYIMDSIIYPMLEYFEQEQTTYTGILGINGIISDSGKISILGCNTFTQNFDTASIFEILDEDIYYLFESCIIGSFSDEINCIKQKDLYSVSLALNNINKENVNNIINGLDHLDENTIVSFYPSVKSNRYLEYEANNGGVMLLTTLASTPAKASDMVYTEAKEITYEGLYYRKDICKMHI